MKKLDSLFLGLSQTMDRVAGFIVLPAIFFIVVVDVVLRYVFNSPLLWSLELSEWLLLLTFAFALPECTRQNGHIRMELIVNNFSHRAQAIVDILYSAGAIWIFYLLGRRSYRQFLYDFGLGRTTENLHLPVWALHFAVLFVCAVLIFYYVMRLIANAIGSEAFTRDELAGLEE